MSVEKPADDQQLIKDLERQLADFQGIADKLGKEVETLQGANSSLNQQLESQRAETHQMQMMLEQIQREMRMQYLAAVKSFSNLMELRSPQLAAHGLRVAELARLIAKEMHASDSALQDIYVASLLHDIGKLGLSDDTLFKPVVELKGDARVALMKHPMKAQAAFHGLSEMVHVSEIIRHHHERYDGQGFPDGLEGDGIPLGARILAVAEDYDELQQGWLAAKTFDELQAQAFLVGAAGKRYDPKVIAVLPTALEKLKAAEKANEKILHGEDLYEGLVLARDFEGPDGFMWLSKGHVVSRHFIGRVREAEQQHGVQLKIYTVKTANSSRSNSASTQPAQQTGHVAL
ncbi:MAG: HD domain-containing protein [Burkholderiales bacterium]|jgi:response regulator RpfG family c-di-GMP phosphodiesterase|uniref:HD-GYP domain-containing protein n=1 Tax=Limnobacter sp. TaxID=2003368 RepID=UPI0039BC5444|nr:HD domain-containing protein [Burkholderiales bacterium]